MTPAAVGWLDELELSPGPPWHAMGTRALEGAWLLADEHREEQLARKRTLLRTRADLVSGEVAGAEAPAEEAAALVAHAVGGGLEPGRRPLEAAALLVQEDLCVLVRRAGAWHLDAGVVCFPSMWSLPAKLGLPLAEVHESVPAYAEELERRVDRFLDRLPADRPVWRRNWFVHDTDELHLPAPPAPVVQPRVPEGLWLRSERQTLRRLPRTGAILFTIRTQQAPASSLATRPDVAGRVAAAVRSWSPELTAYRGAGAWAPRLVDWLEQVAGGLSGTAAPPLPPRGR